MPQTQWQVRSGAAPSPNLIQWSKGHDLWFLGLSRGHSVSYWHLKASSGPEGSLGSCRGHMGSEATQFPHVSEGYIGAAQG